jgi:hypothetical protein
MPGTFQLTLDTTGPAGVAVVLDAGNPAWSTDNVVDALITTTDPVTTGYQVKIWGDVAGVPDEATAVWQTLTPSMAVTLTGGDGVKTVNVRMRDDVWNTSSVASDTITVDTTAPVVTLMSGPDLTKISKVAGKDVSTITWKADSDIQAYKVKVVPSTSSLENAGAQIPAAAGSTNVTGGAVAANTVVTTAIHGADLEAADPGDTTKNVKVFVRDLAGNWSVL